MKRPLMAAATALLATICQADTVTLAIPGQGMNVSFDAPAVTKLKETSSPQQYQYVANADRLNISLFVGAPNCFGAITADANLKCMLPKLGQIPGFVKETVSVDKLPNGLQLSYLVYAPVGDQAIKVLNTHLLFAFNGKWGDFHASMVKPSPAEMAMLMGIGDTLKYVEASPETKPDQ